MNYMLHHSWSVFTTCEYKCR